MILAAISCAWACGVVLVVAVMIVGSPRVPAEERTGRGSLSERYPGRPASDAPDHAPSRGGTSNVGRPTSTLEHTGECTGSWRYYRDRHLVHCAGCLAEYPATPELRLAAIDENQAGMWLDLLTRDGVVRLEREKGAA